VNSFSTKKLSRSGVMDVVECLGNESSLWHCEAKHGNDMSCSSVAYVVCSGSLNATLVDGGGRCAGRLEVQHENQWKRVQAQGWRKDYSKVVCNHLDCGEPLDNPEEYSQGSGNFLTVQCSSGSQITSLRDRWEGVNT
ncbi:CD5 antigen-like, partial [Stegastes partitus]|uniref:CD5 antigen-like n=1 Tax=Stegastes partitus TaxID=144197 RepID=A0A9Y4U2L0_9TELE